ncbi:MAG: methyltransferase domain-containing protein [Desulfobacteraceae bacterium]|nr:methyltransferase domain-containing protein [Desulfobacteraceae bacterium]
MVAPKNKSLYTKRFYLNQGGGSHRSAQQVVPLIVNLINPRSVIDVGCGLGTWLKEFSNYGIEVKGVDGNWVPADQLRIKESEFCTCDLTDRTNYHIFTDSYKLYDLVICLEVAEHLPPELSEDFVDLLIYLSDTVLFSAAIPFQGGNNHVNEQWQSKWASIFEQSDFVALDIVRPYDFK